MSGNKNESAPDGDPTSVRKAALDLLADLDAARSPQAFGITTADPPHPKIEALRQAIERERTAELPIDNPHLVVDGIGRIKAGGQISPEHIRAIVAAAELAVQSHQSFNLRWEADMRAIRRWQEGEPHPDVQALIDAAQAVLGAVEGHEGSADQRAALLSAVREASTGFHAPAGQRELMWPDHADLVVWLIELVEHRPLCPSVDEAAETIDQLRHLYSGSPIIQTAADRMERLANALMASSRRVLSAESDRALIPRLIARWVEANGMGLGIGGSEVVRLAEAIEAGEWLPLRGAAIRAKRAQIELVSGDGAVAVDQQRLGLGYSPDAGGRPTYHGQPLDEGDEG